MKLLKPAIGKTPALNRDEDDELDSFGQDQSNGVGSMTWSPSLGAHLGHRPIHTSHWADQGRYTREEGSQYVSGKTLSSDRSR